MKPVSDRRTRSPGAGPGGEHGLAPHTTNAHCGPPSSARSARRRARAPVSSCPIVTHSPWTRSWRRSARRSRPVRMRCCCWTKQAGMSRPSSPCRTTSPSCSCRRERPNSTRSRTSGSCLTRQLVVGPDLRILRRDRRSLLPGLEQARRPALEDHLDRNARLGTPVLISARWY